MIKEFDIQLLIQKGLNQELKQHLESYPDEAIIHTAQGISLLQFAAYCQNTEAIKILSNYKTKLDAFEAACLGDLKQLKAKIELNPETIHLISPDGFTLVGLAAFFGHFHVLEYLIPLGADFQQPSVNSFKVTPLHSAVARSHVKVVRYLLEQGADPNVLQQGGVSPLHSAAHQGNEEIFQLLIEAEADVSIRSEQGKNAMDFSQEAAHQHIVTLINRLMQHEKIAYVAFLRGINVGGHRKIKMQDLKVSLKALGLENIETYIQSGNVVFSTSPTELSILEQKIEDKIAEDYGFGVKVIIRTQAKIDQIIRNNPYLLPDQENITACYLTLLQDEAKDDLKTQIQSMDFGKDEFFISGDHIYLHCANGYGKTKLTNDLFEKKLKVVATSRNWKTMLKMQMMLHELNT